MFLTMEDALQDLQDKLIIAGKLIEVYEKEFTKNPESWTDAKNKRYYRVVAQRVALKEEIEKVMSP